ncbi:hypothetical protein Rsub_05682 [Raphidocelis subcapitata]|uniref:USP domain-containing protein n=1 Tax=Raphidocelis subcapitata TaxID=307507 RepID=A0A2V0NZK3_9CHLO|nr:hypothetical protein Rsub_05682 [Raphidocelis subcapitata]|eukprot:GBF93071.1 hypothetical protein Rsub_05682 [Raphidocelis subcapitata]
MGVLGLIVALRPRRRRTEAQDEPTEEDAAAPAAAATFAAAPPPLTAVPPPLTTAPPPPRPVGGGAGVGGAAAPCIEAAPAGLLAAWPIKALPAAARGTLNMAGGVKNLCYLNSLVQACASAPQLVAFLRAADTDGPTPGHAVLRRLQAAVHDLLSGSNRQPPVSLDPLLRALIAFDPDAGFKRGQPDCPVTALGALLAAARAAGADVDGACAARGAGIVACAGRNGACGRSIDCAAGAGWVRTHLRRHGGAPTGVRQCLRAGLELPLMGEGAHLCGSCSCGVDGVVPLRSLGPVLFVELVSDLPNNEIRPEDLDTVTAEGFIPESFDAAPMLPGCGGGAGAAVYSLRGIVCGAPGHFVALCRRGDGWLLANDASVERLPGGGGVAPAMTAVRAMRLRPLICLYDSPADAAARGRGGGGCGGGSCAPAGGAVASSGAGAQISAQITADYIEEQMLQLAMMASALDERESELKRREAGAVAGEEGARAAEERRAAAEAARAAAGAQLEQEQERRCAAEAMAAAAAEAARDEASARAAQEQERRRAAEAMAAAAEAARDEASARADQAQARRVAAEAKVAQAEVCAAAAREAADAYSRDVKAAGQRAAATEAGRAAAAAAAQAEAAALQARVSELEAALLAALASPPPPPADAAAIARTGSGGSGPGAPATPPEPRDGDGRRGFSFLVDRVARGLLKGCSFGVRRRSRNTSGGSGDGPGAAAAAPPPAPAPRPQATSGGRPLAGSVKVKEVLPYAGGKGPAGAARRGRRGGAARPARALLAAV